MGWGMMFTLVTYFSEKLYCWILKQKEILPHDKRIFIFDVIAAAIIAFPLETLGLKSGVWDYNYELLNWDWGTVPFFGMPYEALVGSRKLVNVPDGFQRRIYNVIVHPGITAGKVLRLKGQGRSTASGGRGDLLLKVMIQEEKGRYALCSYRCTSR